MPFQEIVCSRYKTLELLRQSLGRSEAACELRIFWNETLATAGPTIPGKFRASCPWSDTECCSVYEAETSGLVRQHLSKWFVMSLSGDFRCHPRLASVQINRREP